MFLFPWRCPVCHLIPSEGFEEEGMKALGYPFCRSILVRWYSSFCELFCPVVMVLALSNRHVTSPLLTGVDGESESPGTGLCALVYCSQ